MTPTETELTFDELDAQMGEMEEGGVPDEWAAAFKKLRTELANKRQKFGPFEQAFSKLGEQDQQAFLTFAETLSTDPAAAGEMFLNASRSIAQVTGADWNEWAGIDAAPETPAETPAEETDVPESEKPIDEIVAEKVQAILDERDKQAQIDREVQRINDKLKDLGYTDPSAADAQLVLWRAKQIENAADVLDAIQQAHTGLDEFILERSKTLVSTTADAGAEVPSDEGSLAEETSPSTDGRPQDMKDMKAQMNERLGQIYDQSSLGDAAV